MCVQGTSRHHFPLPPPAFTAVFYVRIARRASTQPAPPCQARASAQVKHHAVHQSPVGQQASRADHHQGPSSQLRVVDLQDGKKAKGEGEEAAMYMIP
jgi:hypothetical protein